MQNGFCLTFHGRMGDELLNESLFFGLDHARTKRPHSALGYLTFGSSCRQSHRNMRFGPQP